jgi:hypothetical protein
MPLLLQSEFDRAVAGTLTSEGVLAIAREVGFESLAIQPRCLAHRRVKEPGINRQVFFLRFDLPAFAEFRRRIAQQVRGTAGHAASFDPDALPSIMIIAANDANFSRWMPLRPEAEDDCVAPVAAR